MRQQFDSLVQRVSHLERAFLFSDHLGALAPLPGLEDTCCTVTPGMNIADRVAQAPAPFLPAHPSEAFNIGEPLVDSLPYFALPSVGPCLRPPSRRAPADQETRMAQVQAALIECMEPAEKIDGAEEAKSDIGPPLPRLAKRRTSVAPSSSSPTSSPHDRRSLDQDRAVRPDTVEAL